ncbi:NADH-quinone oxidoreductase subunit K [Thiomicrospira microaerophila]|jgi:multicomponent Na+:H+ antiporter subunit C|uniref:NADH-quinone oxidoreductase subunit K n=1 Tax=Thiomicrospira microaerophila TaxID=406020 RepID=UPI0005C9D489|nr:NADH-quinone oxidoreductase subunit K [Thiomicrospira microaerophila]
MNLMITSYEVYLFSAAGLILIGLFGLARRVHLLHKILSLNVMGAGVFMLLLTLASRGETPDAVPQALVLTGIVVAISATALGLALMQRLASLSESKQAQLDEDVL